MLSCKSTWLQIALATAAVCLVQTESTWPFPSPFPEANPEFHLTTMEMAQKYGYPVEKHEVTTQDGYILEMHRIPRGRWEPRSGTKRRGRLYAKDCPNGNRGTRPVVLLQHGAGSSSLHWIMLGPNQGLGFILASLGYDVWMPNSRGNVYSRGHVALDANDPQGPFWNFSWQEMAEYDSPAQIDYILAATGQTKLLAVGYSQGATQLMALLSERPEYNTKFRAIFLLAPLTYFTNPTTLPKRVFSFTNDLRWIERIFDIREETPYGREQIDLIARFCGDGSITQGICATMWCLNAGFDCAQLNASQLPAVIGRFEGGSTKQRLHYFQLTSSGEFKKYDYGLSGNMAAYGRSTPPLYNLSRVHVPVSLHYSPVDVIVDIVDIDYLYSKLANPIGKFPVPLQGFNHMGFIVAKDVKSLLYDTLASLMKDF